MTTHTEPETTIHASPPAAEGAALPPSFLCPLTRQLMQVPMMDHDGHNFEKQAILEFIRHEGQFICPISHKPLVESDLIPNVVLQETIRRWKDHHHHSSSSSNEHPSTDDNNNKDTQKQVPPHASITMDESMELTQTSTTEDSTELGKAINSLSQVFASKEGYCILADESNVQANDDDDDDDLDHLLECGLTRSESSASFLYTMFLPQERQALRRRAREQRHAQRLAWFVKVGYAVSVVLISLVLLLCLAKIVRLLLPVLTTTTTTSTGAWSTEVPATNLSTNELARPTQKF